MRLSAKHGVNPSMGVCFWCGEDDGTIALPGRLPGDAEAPRRAVWSMEPCAKCKANMALGITLMEANGDTKPEPTGRWVVVTEDCVRRLFNDDVLPAVLRHRKAFMKPAAFAQFVVT